MAARAAGLRRLRPALSQREGYSQASAEQPTSNTLPVTGRKYDLSCETMGAKDSFFVIIRNSPLPRVSVGPHDDGQLSSAATRLLQWILEDTSVRCPWNFSYLARTFRDCPAVTRLGAVPPARFLRQLILEHACDFLPLRQLLKYQREEEPADAEGPNAA
jgi:hypothetical protein